MKNILAKILLLTLSSLTTGLLAQSHKKQQFDLNVGVGIGNNVIGIGHTSSTPPLSVSGEFGVTDDISVGGYLGFTSATYQFSGWDDCYGNNGNGNGNPYYFTDTYKWTYFIAGIRGSYHFGKFIKNDKLDVYAGLMLGYDFAHYTYSTNSVCFNHIRYSSPTYGGFAFSAHGGARYRFTEHFGLFGELGYGISILNLGLNFKF